MFVSLPFGMSLTFLLGYLSGYVASKSLLAFIFILLFSCAVAIAVSQLLFSLLGLPCRSSLLSAIFNSSCNFIAMPFSSLPFILLLFSLQYCGFSFKAGP